MKEFKTLSDLCNNFDLIPEIVALDVMARIWDWIASGGVEEDPYIQNQLAFASKFIDYESNFK